MARGSLRRATGVRRWLAAATACAGLAVPLAARPQTGAIALDDFFEHLGPEVKTSATSIAGVMSVSGAAGAAIEPQLRLPRGTPPEWLRDACMQVRSRDGRYYAEGTIRNGALSSANALSRIQFKSSHEKELKALGALDLGMVVLAGKCGGGAGPVPAYYVVDRDGRAAVREPRVRLFLNSERLTTRVEFLNAAQQRVQAPCEEIKVGVRRTFDLYCDLESPSPGVSEVRVLRKRFERDLEPLPFKLLYGG